MAWDVCVDERRVARRDKRVDGCEGRMAEECEAIERNALYSRRRILDVGFLKF